MEKFAGLPYEQQPFAGKPESNTIRIVKSDARWERYILTNSISGPSDIVIRCADTVLLNTSELSVNPCERCDYKSDIDCEHGDCYDYVKYQAEQALLKKIQEMSK